jgi:SOS-response transcriptional repressor LexA
MTPPTLSPMMTEDRPKLTARQAEVLDVIEAAIRQQGYPPTIREIGAKLGIRSPQGVSDHLSGEESLLCARLDERRDHRHPAL